MAGGSKSARIRPLDGLAFFTSAIRPNSPDSLLGLQRGAKAAHRIGIAGACFHLGQLQPVLGGGDLLFLVGENLVENAHDLFDTMTSCSSLAARRAAVQSVPRQFHARHYIHCASGHHQGRRRIEQHDIAVGARFTGEKRHERLGVFRGDAALQVDQAGALQARILGRDLESG